MFFTIKLFLDTMRRLRTKSHLSALSLIYREKVVNDTAILTNNNTLCKKFHTLGLDFCSPRKGELPLTLFLSVVSRFDLRCFRDNLFLDSWNGVILGIVC